MSKMHFISPFRRSCLPYRCRRLVIATLLLFSLNSHATWRIEPQISAGLEYDDNPQLIPNELPVEEQQAYLFDAAVNMLNETQLTQFWITPRIRISRFDNASSLDSEDWFLESGYLYTGQRSNFELRGSYADESVRTAERDDVDFDVESPDDIPIDDSGRVFQSEKRQRLNLGTTWTYRAGQRSSLLIGADYRDVGYDQDSQIVILEGYTESRARLGYGFDLTQRDTLSLNSYYRSNDFDDLSDTITGYGLAASYTRKLTEQSSFVMSLGADKGEDENGISQTNPIGEISYVRNNQRSRFLATYGQSITGSGAGTVSVRDQINFNFYHDLTERVAIGLGGTAYRTRALDQNDTSLDDREYLQLRALLSWRVLRNFVLDFDYSYTAIDRQVAIDVSDEADSNRIRLWFRYSPLF